MREPSPVSVLLLTLEIWYHYLENYVEKDPICPRVPNISENSGVIDLFS